MFKIWKYTFNLTRTVWYSKLNNIVQFSIWKKNTTKSILVGINQNLNLDLSNLHMNLFENRVQNKKKKLTAQFPFWNDCNYYKINAWE